MLKQDTLAQRKKKMRSVFFAIANGKFEEVQRILKTNPKYVNIKDDIGRTLLDVAISCGNLQMAKFLFEKGGRPNLENYCNGKNTPVHDAAKWRDFATLKWAFEEEVLPMQQILNIKDHDGWTPLDGVIAEGELETAKCLWEIGGRPNLKIYCDGLFTPVHKATMYFDTTVPTWVFKEGILPLRALNIKDSDGWTPLDWAIADLKFEMAQCLWKMGGRPNLEKYYDGNYTTVHKIAGGGYTNLLKWTFDEKIFPLDVFNMKDHKKRTPLDFAIVTGQQDAAAFLRRLRVYFVFSVMQCVKRDHQCVLRRLPDELLDMVVDVVASRFHLMVEW